MNFVKFNTPLQYGFRTLTCSNVEKKGCISHLVLETERLLESEIFHIYILLGIFAAFLLFFSMIGTNLSHLTICFVGDVIILFGVVIGLVKRNFDVLLEIFFDFVIEYLKKKRMSKQ